MTIGDPALPVIPGFHVEAPTAAGTWLARQDGTGRVVQITVITAMAAGSRRAVPAAFAACEHPALPGVLAAGRLEDGATWMALPDIHGSGLDHALVHSAVVTQAVRDDWVAALETVAEGLAVAHRQGVVHRFLDPAAVLFTAHGQVMVVGWEQAVALSAGPAPRERSGTVLGASPEQARGEAADTRSDVYALGALLFLALYGHPPVRDDGEAQVWARRARGDIDEPVTAIRQRVTLDVATVARRALAVNPDDRYRDAGAFARALASARQAAARPMEPMARTSRRGPLIVASAALVAVVCTAVWWQQRNQIAPWWGWGRPVIEEHFATDAWREQWRVAEGRWRRDGAGIVSEGPVGNVLVYDRRLTPPVAFECRARMDADAPPGDISLFWCESDPYAPGEIFTKRAHLAQVGGWDNTQAALTVPQVGGGISQTHRQAFTLEPGREYVLRMEVEADGLRVFLDGRLLFARAVVEPMRPGWFGVLGYYPGKHFTACRVMRARPSAAGPLTIPDALLARDHVADAVRDYEAALRDGGLTADQIGQAQYRLGSAHAANGDAASANRVWQAIAVSPWRELAACRLLSRWTASGNHAAIVSGLREVGLASDPRIVEAQRQVWLSGLAALGQHAAPTVVLEYLAVRQALFATDLVSEEPLVEALIQHGALDALVDVPLRDARAVALRLLSSEQAQTVIEDFSEHVQFVARAHLMRGDYTAITQTLSHVPWAVRQAALESGDVSVALDTSRFSGHEMAMVTVAEGRGAELLRDERQPLAIRRMAALLLNDEVALTALAPQPNLMETAVLSGSVASLIDHELGPWHRTLREVLLALERDEPERCPTWFNPIRGEWWFAQSVIQPFLVGGLPGLRDSLAEAYAGNRYRAGQKAWHLAGFVLGHIDEAAYLAQPAARVAAGNHDLALALRAELNDDPTAAIAAYRRHLARSPIQRPMSEYLPRDLLGEGFASWRLRRLAP